MNCSQIHEPSTNTNFGARAFRCAAPAIWNSIPQSVRSSPSLASFKRNLKPGYSLTHPPNLTKPSIHASDALATVACKYKFTLHYVITLQYYDFQCQLRYRRRSLEISRLFTVSKLSCRKVHSTAWSWRIKLYRLTI